MYLFFCNDQSCFSPWHVPQNDSVIDKPQMTLYSSYDTNPSIELLILTSINRLQWLDHLSVGYIKCSAVVEWYTEGSVG